MKAVADSHDGSVPTYQLPNTAAQRLTAVPRQRLGGKNLPYVGHPRLQLDLSADNRRTGAGSPPSAPIGRSTKRKGFT